jgi:hypothetical protein
MDVNQKYRQSCQLISRNGFIITKIMSSQIVGQCYHVIRMQLRRPESTQGDLQKDTILGHVSYFINLVQRRNRQDRTQNFRKQ